MPESPTERRQGRVDRRVQEFRSESAAEALMRLRATAVSSGNLFAELMEATKVCTLGQLSGALYEVGGQYRRNM